MLPARPLSGAPASPVVSHDGQRAPGAPTGAALEPALGELAPAIAVASGVMFLVVVLRTAWVSDDAFIAIRALDNLLQGLGWGVNPGVRVQVSTSPLWSLLCLPFAWIVGDPYLALVLPSLLLVLGLVILLVRKLRDARWHAPAALLGLAASPTFVAFSTSGLENSLSHFLIACFCMECLTERLRPTRRALWLGAALVLTRLDWAVLVGPVLAVSWLSRPVEGVKQALAPLGILGVWFAFATFYFGFPLPNTAYAKLNVELETGARLGRGLEYLLDSAARDPLLTVLVLVTSVLVTLRGVPWNVRLLQGGALAYGAYVLWIGGDFMSGRFLTGTYLASLLVLLDIFRRMGGIGLRAAPVLGVVFFVFALPHLDSRSPHSPTECRVPITGIVDERACYAEWTGLAQNVHSKKWRTHGYLGDLRKRVEKVEGAVVAFDLVGMASYGAPRPVHIVERFALSDPLLARIRVAPRGNWRMGHFLRPLPSGYLASLRTGENLVEDACLRSLYGDLKIATTEPLVSKARLRALWRLNTGRATCSPVAERIDSNLGGS